MFRPISALLLVILPALVCTAQQAPPQSKQNDVHTTIPVQLEKSLDSKKLKPGDLVVARTEIALQGNGVTVPSGSRVIGHVTQAQARSKGDPQSSLGIIFDKIELTSDKELPMQGYIQAVAPNPAPEPPVGPAGGGGTIASQGPGDQRSTVPGPGSTLGGINPNNNPGLPSNQGAGQRTPNQAPLLDPNAHGVAGFRHLELSKDSVLTTTDKDLKLDSGTQLLIRTEAKQPAQSQ